jgi:hypothetical protein
MISHDVLSKSMRQLHHYGQFSANAMILKLSSNTIPARRLQRIAPLPVPPTLPGSKAVKNSFQILLSRQHKSRS